MDRSKAPKRPFGVPKRVVFFAIAMSVMLIYGPTLSPRMRAALGFNSDKQPRRPRDFGRGRPDPVIPGEAPSNTSPIVMQEIPAPPSSGPAAKKRLAVIVLCRKSDVGELGKTIRSFQSAYLGVPRNVSGWSPSSMTPPAIEREDRRGRAYDFIVFSEVPWSDSAKSTLQSHSVMPVLYDVLDEYTWGTPQWINRTLFAQVLAARQFYGNSESYRRMCRFFAGPIWKLPILQGYEFLWRLDSHVRYLCDLAEDPVAKLEEPLTAATAVIPPSANVAADSVKVVGSEDQAVYGYSMSQTELMYTIPTLWRTMMTYAQEQGLAEHVKTQWGIDPSRESSRGCHYWNNFEVARLSFFGAGTPYQRLFEYLDKSGGFFYERWGDAPIRSWALTMLAKPTQVKWYDTGYQHPWWVKCPSTDGGKCPDGSPCTPDDDIQPNDYRTDGRMCKLGD